MNISNDTAMLLFTKICALRSRNIGPRKLNAKEIKQLLRLENEFKRFISNT